MRKAATSIPSNIAEGCGRTGDKELARFLSIAAGSASELASPLLLALGTPMICRTAEAIVGPPTMVGLPPAASFDPLIVDAASKVTLPGFRAFAVKARRRVVVGDRTQLPPFNNTEANERRPMMCVKWPSFY